MSKKKRIEAGDESHNYQADGDIHNHTGLTYTEAKDIFMDLFELNFLKLGDDVKKIVDERAEDFIKEYLKELKEESPESIKNTVDPDIRASIYEAQKSYVRSGNKDFEKILVDLLVARTKENTNDFKRVVLNEAVEISNKITSQQMECLALIFLFTNPVYLGMDVSMFVNHILIKFKNLYSSNKIFDADLKHLEQVGCISISSVGYDMKNVLLSRGFAEFNENRHFQEKVGKYPELIEFMNFYELKYRKFIYSTVSPVGSAISVSYLKSAKEINMQLDNFLVN